MAEPVDTLSRRAEWIRGKRSALLPFWQEMAEQFHPLRAQFTRQFYLSEQFMDTQLTSYPLIVARELKNTFSAMLRPRDQDWFEMTIDREERLDRRGRAWLEWATKVQRRAMYDRRAQFTRATKEWGFRDVRQRSTHARDRHQRAAHALSVLALEGHRVGREVRRLDRRGVSLVEPDRR
jgi:hypothetical protein